MAVGATAEFTVNYIPDYLLIAPGEFVTFDMDGMVIGGLMRETGVVEVGDETEISLEWTQGPWVLCWTCGD